MTQQIFVAFTITFLQNTLSLCGNCLPRGVFLKKKDNAHRTPCCMLTRHVSRVVCANSEGEDQRTSTRAMLLPSRVLTVEDIKLR